MTKVLVIEDEPLLREEVVMWLSHEGFETIDAGDGQAGLESALHNSPDLIICDITMPRLDGYGVLLEVRSHPATAQIPFIFMTARSTHEDIRKGMELGADDYVTKPFTRLELLQAVQTRLEKNALLAQEHQRKIIELQNALEHEQEQRMLKAKMVAMYSHDFRNPLSAILSANDLLRHYGHRLDEQRRQLHMERIEIAGRQLLQMLDEMLLISQIESGNLALSPEKVAIDNFLRPLVNEFQTMHSETHRLVFECDLTDPVMVDPRLLHQIVLNLLSNAIKYSPQGGEVRVTVAKATGEQFAINIQDHGIGIPEADQPRLFAAFQRGSNVKGLPGTGLGLAIVKQAVEMHNGTIELESQSNQGTTVRVILPVILPSQREDSSLAL